MSYAEHDYDPYGTANVLLADQIAYQDVVENSQRLEVICASTTRGSRRPTTRSRPALVELVVWSGLSSMDAAESSVGRN